MKEKEEERLNLLKEEENKLYESGKVQYICGIDEAGRGPLARACCCWISYNAKGLNDRRSK